MEGLSSFLIFAVFFYLMMRFGCGAHMMHGHHGHSEKDGHSKNNDKEPTVDPVCGMKVADEEGYGKLHNGLLFRFCSRKCLDKFDQNPEKYISKPHSKSHEEHHHES